MKTLFLAAALAPLAACATEPPALPDDTAEQPAALNAISHDQFDTPFGRIHHMYAARRVASHGVMLLHGDFSSFTTNFVASGFAQYLVQHGEDVWGVDRRWATIPADGDLAPLATMGLQEEVRDTGMAIALARLMRLGGGDRDGKLALLGFSHGAQLAYTYAAATRSANLTAIAGLDFYAGLRTDQTDARAAICAGADSEYADVASGMTDAPNDFFQTLGTLAQTSPDDPSPLWDGLTNRQAFLTTAGQTYLFVPFAPAYHLLAPTLGTDPDAPPTGLRSTPEPVGAQWFAAAPPHESMREAADFDAMLCSDNTRPIAAPLADIAVPIYYLGAAGGVGDLGIEALGRTSSHDITTSVISLGGPIGDVATEYGHGDLLFATDAPTRAWAPLASWLGHH